MEEIGGGASMPLAMLGEIVTTAAMASKNLYVLLDRDGKGKNGMNVQKSYVEEDRSGYGCLLTNHFSIQ